MVKGRERKDEPTDEVVRFAGRTADEENPRHGTELDAGVARF
jgi:hypothetical protein